MKEHATDKILVERAQKGHRQSFDLLVLKYQNRITRLVSRYLHVHSDALDVTQETFIRAWQALPKFRGDSAFYTWLYRIAVNTAKNCLVSEARHFTGRGEDISTLEQMGTSEGLREEATPEALLARDELQAAVLKAIKELPDELRIVIVQREFDGMSYQEIADLMSCPLGTVRSRIFRAREAIDNRIKHLIHR